MISEIVDPPERLREAAQELGETIAKNSPAAMAATKRALWARSSTGLTDACRAGAADLVVDVGPPRPGRGPTGLRREARRRVADRCDARSRTCSSPAGDDGRALLRARRRGRAHRWPRCAAERPTIADRLDDAGVEPGHAVGVMLPNGGELVAALFGVWRAGGVYVPLNPRLRADLAHVVERSSRRHRHDAEHVDRFGAAVVVLDDGVTLRPGGSATAASTRRRAGQLTSGTTGRPSRCCSARRRARADRPRPRHAAAGAGSPGQAAHAEPHPRVARALGRHLPGAVRVPHVGAPVVVMDALRHRGVRRASSTASASAPPCCRPRRWRCWPTTSRSRSWRR